MHYDWNNSTDGLTVYDTSITIQNSFSVSNIRSPTTWVCPSRISTQGSTVQEATSLLTMTNQDCYQYGTQYAKPFVEQRICLRLVARHRCYSTYGFQYAPGTDGYITWISDGKPAWTLNGVGVQSNQAAQISQRLISREPMVSPVWP